VADDVCDGRGRQPAENSEEHQALCAESRLIRPIIQSWELRPEASHCNTGSNDVDAARQIALSTHPIGRLGMPEDIAKGIVFLASDDAGFMTGAGLVVDGGLTAQ
jgi:NAD(P)-dependent dehydrogenase (short-subunit alcohol dehydrogenase family)